MEQYQCAKCNEVLERGFFTERKRQPDGYRPVMSRCKRCRRDDHMATKYPDPCISCRQHKKLEKNDTCRKCNDESGLRYCSNCNKLLPLFFMFYGRNPCCKTCLKTRLTT